MTGRFWRRSKGLGAVPNSALERVPVAVGRRPSGWMPLGELASAQPQDDWTERDRDDHRRRRVRGHSHVPHPCSSVGPCSFVGDVVGLCRGLPCLFCRRPVEGPARDRRDQSGLQLLLGWRGVVVSEVWRRADTRVSGRPPPESAENCVVARTSSGPPQQFGQLVGGPCSFSRTASR